MFFNFPNHEKACNSVQCCTILYRLGDDFLRGIEIFGVVCHIVLFEIVIHARSGISKVAPACHISVFCEHTRFRTTLYRIVQDWVLYRNPRKSSKYQLFASRKHHFPLGVSNFCSGTIAVSKKILHDALSGFRDFLDKYSKISSFREHFCCTILYNAVQFCTILYRNSKIMIWVARCLYYRSVGLGT